jgi:protein-L-isoaspartate(D-aspartate) O-methyltransferase
VRRRSLPTCAPLGLAALCLLGAAAGAGAAGVPLYAAQRAAMVQRLRARGINHEPTLVAMGRIERERFVLPGLWRQAYTLAALPALPGVPDCTLTNPYTLARALSALLPSNPEAAKRATVLEIGTGPGYSTAVTADIATWVTTVEMRPELFHQARRRFGELGLENITAILGDGPSIAERSAPNAFSAIIVHANLPREAAMQVLSRLATGLQPGGSLVVPLEGKLSRFVLERGTLALDHVVDDARYVPLYLSRRGE